MEAISKWSSSRDEGQRIECGAEFWIFFGRGRGWTLRQNVGAKMGTFEK